MPSAELVVDSRGRRCPLPVIDLAKAVADVPVGGVIVVLADDPAAATDIPAWCRMRGHDYLGTTTDGDTSADDGTDDSGTAYRVRRVR